MLCQTLLVLTIAAVYVFKGIKSAGNNDENIFDWLDKDDHLISREDLRFLENAQKEQTNRHSSGGNSATSPGIPHQITSTNTHFRSVGLPQMTEAEKNEKKRKRNERNRMRNKELRENHPDKDRARKDLKNKREKEKIARMTPQEKRDSLTRKYQVRSKTPKIQPQLTEEQKQKKALKNRKRRQNYKANLERKIITNQATDRQRQSYQNEFGKSNFDKIFKKLQRS